MSKHTLPIQIRFSDVDMLQHVNNAIYATYMELGRIRFFDEIISGHNWRETGIIVASLTIDFIAPIYYNEMLNIETEITFIGNKSFKIEHRFVIESDTGPILKATGSTTMVCFQYVENRSILFPQSWRDQINAFQNTAL